MDGASWMPRDAKQQATEGGMMAECYLYFIFRTLDFIVYFIKSDMFISTIKVDDATIICHRHSLFTMHSQTGPLLFIPYLQRAPSVVVLALVSHYPQLHA